MKEHTSNFKNKIKEMGRQIQGVVTHVDTETELEIFSVKYSYEGNILKSVMKCLEIECTDELQKGDLINYKFGLKINNSFEQLDFGNYIVKDIEKLEDTNHYKVTCYDLMLHSMRDYNAVNVQFPITIREYITAICDVLDIDFANEQDEFANYDKILQVDPYDGLYYTYRDVLDELAQVTASTICINKDDELEIRYVNDTEDTIDEHYLKDVNVDFGEKFGPVNSIVLSRSAESDNVFIQDGESVAQNGLCEIKIVDNQIMNFNDRSDYLPDLLEKLDGLEYYINDFSSTGICYYDLLDKYTISIDDTDYNCIMFNDDINITLGLEETIHTDLPEQSETDYTKADKTDRKINQTYLIVDKQNQKIQSLITQIGDRSQKETSVTQDIDRLEILVDNIEDLTAEVTGINPITLPDCIEGSILDFRIIGNNTVFSGLTPSESLVPSNSLYPRGASRIFVKHYNDEDELVSTDVYSLKAKAPLRQYSTTIFDEFRYSFDVEEEESKAKIIRRVGVTAGGTLYPLAEEVVETVNIPDIMLTRGKNVIDIVSPYYANCYARYVLLNAFTDKFATTYELKSSIELLQGEIDIQVSEKVDKDEVIADINAAIVDHQAILRLTGNQVIINSDNFQLAADGSINATNGTFSGWIDATSGQIGKWTLNKQGVLYGNAIVSGNTYQSGMDTRNNDMAFYTGLDITDGQSHYLTEANVYITKSGTIHANKFHGNVDSGYFRLDYDSGRRALWLGSNNLYYYIDDQNNSFFGGLSRNNRGFTFELLSGYFFSIHDYLHNISIAEFYRQDDVGNAGYINLFMKTWYYAGGVSGYEVATKNDICDKNVKKNIKESSKKALDIVNKIQFKQFDWDEKKIDRKGHIDVGVIAQQLKELDENYVEETVIRKENKEEKVYTINNLNLLSTALKAIQELSQKVESLEEEIRKLKGEK